MHKKCLLHQYCYLIGVEVSKASNAFLGKISHILGSQSDVVSEHGEVNRGGSEGESQGPRPSFRGPETPEEERNEYIL